MVDTLIMLCYCGVPVIITMTNNITLCMRDTRTVDKTGRITLTLTAGFKILILELPIVGV